ncbi:MFS transporter [Raineyella sp. LH-20]|uniref:MFS transporter n=1 Tax=Raineyella sp. LH-20 TaxID=3081204 RepID=UPI0029548B8A|nr:MFS transporter [Raineyella sp. LH-20]WOP18129.1 MFS transporter [Raineyella sp. LH-20]
MIGIVVYAVAVMQRSTLGVAGIEASDHFGAGAGIVSVFVVLQLAVYAAAQVPVGLALDRFGSRRVITVGAVLMAVGQLLVGVTGSVPVAIIGRILVGLGDAMTFNSVIRLVPAWFAPHQVPILTQLTGLIGQAGQILSAIPFRAVLENAGWQTAFLAAAGASVIAAVLMGVFGRTAPSGQWRPNTSGSPAALLTSVRAVVTTPSTAAGFWVHFSTCFSAMLFPLMWGFPYLTAGLGYSPALASTLLSFFVLVAIPAGPVVGRITARHPRRRADVALLLVWLQVVCWTITLLWPGVPPVGMLVVLIVALALGGPGSNIGFDYIRTSQPPQRVGTGTGMVIMGGFIACLVSILVIGLVLDAVSTDGHDSRQAYTVALATQAPIYLIGLVGIYLSRRRLRAAGRH